MRVVTKEKDLNALLEEAQGEAERAFGNPAVFLERFVGRAKHLEVQILGDQHGNVVHLHERDCSVQRRYQKVVEVAPSIGLPEETVSELCSSAVKLARGIGYDRSKPRRNTRTAQARIRTKSRRKQRPAPVVNLPRNTCEHTHTRKPFSLTQTRRKMPTQQKLQF